MAREVIMPALDMAQDTGVIVAWHKALGDAVEAGEILMEVETDKATMEVEAGADGYVTELRVAAGEDVPVGDVVAVISVTADAAPSPPRLEPAEPAPDPTRIAPEPESAPPVSHARQANGRILASPKARRVAEERGLDLARLVEAGRPQPFHVCDLEALATLPAPRSAPGAAPVPATSVLAARAAVAAAGFDAFVAWLKTEAGIGPQRVLAAFAAGSLRAATGTASPTVRVHTPRSAASAFADPDLAGLSALEAVELEGEPGLILHDLTATRLSRAELAGSPVPTLTVGRDADRLVVALSVSADRMDDAALIACLDGFAARLEDPLRHLL